jgi:glutathione peroxidase
MSVYEYSLPRPDGTELPLSELEGHTVLLVNVASKCGLTPQYEGLQALNNRYRERGLIIVGVPCNQFGGQEPLEGEEIAEFCSANYSVDFALTAKIDVNGVHGHPLYRELSAVVDDHGTAGDVEWNFEKFLVSPTGDVLRRFRPQVKPDDPEFVSAIESALP